MNLGKIPHNQVIVYDGQEESPPKTATESMGPRYEAFHGFFLRVGHSTGELTHIRVPGGTS